MADALWTGGELAEIFGPPPGGAMPERITGISIDTRTLQKGDVFFAIKGDRNDGHDYVSRAFAAGAVLAVVAEAFQGDAAGPLVRVADTLEALNMLGRAGRRRSKARIIAVTGSVGKTGTKEMLRLMLGTVGRVHASEKSYNNHWGVPLSLARLPRDADYAVFEVGMNHPGEITPLTKLVRPHLAIVTTVAPVHLEFFAGVEEIAEAKAEIFHGLEPSGTAILNRENAQFALLAERATACGAERIVGFGSDASAEARLIVVEGGDGGSLIEAEILGEPITYELGAPGDHLAMNSLAALAAVKLAGANIETGSAALAAFGAPQGRGAQSVHRIAGGQFLLIDESYNANPASVSAALKVLGDVPPSRASRRIAVLGDMLELGSQSEAMHMALAEPIKAAGIDSVYCCGTHMEALFDALEEAQQGGWSEDSDGLRDTLPAAIRAGDAIMIKGSLGSRMGPLVNAIKDRFPPLRTADKTAAE